MELWQTEKQIYDLESTYLEETAEVIAPLQSQRRVEFDPRRKQCTGATRCLISPCFVWQGTGNVVKGWDLDKVHCTLTAYQSST